MQNLLEVLLEIGHSYDSAAPSSSPGQLALKKGEEVIRRLLPAGLHVTSGGGKGLRTKTPWLGILDPDETTRPQTGIYVVYIFSADLKSVAITLLQGTDQGHHKKSLTRKQLLSDATVIRNAISDEALSLFADELRLGVPRSRQRRYEAGAIATKIYRLSSLPSMKILERDLYSILRIYRMAIEAKKRLLLSSPGTVISPSISIIRGEGDPFWEFKPKDDSDYEQQVIGKQIRKSRSHETLIRDFGEFAARKDLRPATNVHPRDLTFRCGDMEWLVEAKIVRDHAAQAVREAIGQLLEYEFLIYKDRKPPQKLALFSEPVGDAYISLLTSLQIAAIWKSNGKWIASTLAENVVRADPDQVEVVVKKV